MPKFLCLNREVNGWAGLPPEFQGDCEIVEVASLVDALHLLQSESFDGLCFGQSPQPPTDGRTRSIQQLLVSSMVLDNSPDGIALLDCDNQVVYANKRMARWFGKSDLTGHNFYQAIGNPDIHEGELSPLSTAVARQRTCTATMHLNEKYYQLNVAPVLDPDGQCAFLVVTVRDSTQFTLQRQKLEALHQAGMALADLRPEEIFEMDIDERIDLLKDNILHYTKDLLNYDVVEIRTRAHASGRIKIRHTYEVVLTERMGSKPDSDSDPRVPHGGVCAVATSEIACVNAEGRPVPLPSWLVPTDGTGIG